MRYVALSAVRVALLCFQATPAEIKSKLQSLGGMFKMEEADLDACLKLMDADGSGA